jgi:hypothetical protein
MTEACALCPGRLVDDVGHRLGAALGDVIPPEAQKHLLNAQRELLLALVVTIEHNAARGQPAKPSGTRRRRKTASPRPSRVELE